MVINFNFRNMEKVLFTFEATKSKLIMLGIVVFFGLIVAIGISWDGGYNSGRKDALKESREYLTEFVNMINQNYTHNDLVNSADNVVDNVAE